MIQKSQYTSAADFGYEELLQPVSVIVPAFDESGSIEDKLKNLLNQDYPLLEVIVINDGSKDQTPEITQQFIDVHSDCKFKFRLINNELNMGKASSINRALKFCSYDIVIISDADTLLEEKAIQLLVQSFKDHKVGAVTGKLSMNNYNKNSSTFLEKSYRDIFDILRKGESNIDSTPIFNGALIAFRKNHFTSLKPNTLADDTEMAINMRESGKKAIFNSSAVVYASTPTRFKVRTKQKVRRAEGIIQAFTRHHSMLFNRKYGLYGNLIFPGEFFLHAVAPSFFMFFGFLSVLSIWTFFQMALYSEPYVVISVLILAVAASYLLNCKLKISPLRLAITFIENQVFLVIALLSLVFKRKSSTWEKTND
jgi:cellulose synthase/poly-beta-1,6-N-acetylglucosamine synthase-like glycosyltransferase